jgi:hypothetical protein
MVLSNCSSASTEVPEELAVGGKLATAGERATTEQVAPSPSQKEPTMVEIATRLSFALGPGCPFHGHESS